MEKTKKTLSKQTEYPWEVVSAEQEKKFSNRQKVLSKKLQKASFDFIHEKFTEEEDENCSVEAVRKAEQIVGQTVAFGRKYMQKQHMKREYAKLYYQKRLDNTSIKIKDKIETVAKKTEEAIRKNIVEIVIITVFFLLLLFLITVFSSCGAMFIDTATTVMISSYFSEPKEIDAVELKFSYLEMQLQTEINQIETDYFGYDEYEYELDTIGHNPFVFMSYLATLYTQFVYQEVEEEIELLFKEMYHLTAIPTTEIRTRTELRTRTEIKTGTRPITHLDGSISFIEYEYEAEIEYEIEVEYEVSILKVKLEAIPLEIIVESKMNMEQKELYELYQDMKGDLQVLGNPLNMDWYNSVSSYYGYRIHPLSGEQQLHRGIDIAVAEGTPVYATQEGSIATVGYDEEYGNYIVITNNEGYTTKYAHLSSVIVCDGQTIIKGMQIGTVGSTGNSTESHLHFEMLKNGVYFNPLFYVNVE